MDQMCKEPDCKDRALSLSSRCFRHIQDAKAYIDSLCAHNNAGKSMEGFYLKNLNAPSINLMRANLKGANLAGAFLPGANFCDANLSQADMIGSNLSECDFAGADCVDSRFMMADLSRSRFWHADLTNADLSEANLQGADLLNAVLFKSNLYHSTLRDARFLTRENFKGAGSKEGVDEKGHKAARESYANLKQYFISHARHNDASWASYNENRMELRHLWKEKKAGFFPFLLMGLLCGWGERPLRATVAAVSIITLYGILFFALKSIAPAYPADYKPAFFDYIYYSTITFTTVGYGDFLPKQNTAYKLLAGSEAFIGIFMMGLFVFTLGRRYSSR